MSTTTYLHDAFSPMVRSYTYIYPFDWHARVDLIRTLPVVVVLHGGGQTPLNLAKNVFGTSLKSWFDGSWETGGDTPGPQKLKFIGVIPHGIGAGDYGWNSGLFGQDAELLREDDIAFIGEVLDRVNFDLLAWYNTNIGPLARVLDPDKVIVIGFSNGGQMAYRCAVELGATGWQVVAVVAMSTSIGGWERYIDWNVPVAMMPAPDVDWTPAAALPLLATHSRDDPNILLWDDGITDQSKAGVEDQLLQASDWEAIAPSRISGFNSALRYVDRNFQTLPAGWMLNTTVTPRGGGNFLHEWTAVGAGGGAVVRRDLPVRFYEYANIEHAVPKEADTIIPQWLVELGLL